TVTDASAFRCNGAIVFDGISWRIVVSARLKCWRRDFVILHELAHWALGPSASEDACDALAAALLVPRRVFLQSLIDVGPQLSDLADHLEVSESFVALRFAEVTGSPVALISPSRIRVRGGAAKWSSL